MRRLGLLLLAAILAGCACTAIGCASRIRVEVGADLLPGTTYEASVCVDSNCSTQQLVARDDVSVGAAGAFTIDTANNVVEYALGDGDFGGSHRITFSLLDDGGRQVAAIDEPEMQLTKNEPNGGWPCGPTCWQADFSFR